MFADIFNTLLKERGTNALSVAKQINVPKSIVYEWKQGKREPSMENLIKLSDYFQVSLEYLSGIDNEQTSENERELLVLLRAAKSISEEDHDALINSFKANLNVYIKSNDKRTTSDN